MNVFIFQSLPEKFDLRNELIKGKEDTWYATRYRNEMAIGDLVYFWMGGDEKFRGIYGWGEITKAPYIKEGWDSYGVDVKYLHKFSHHIPSSLLKNDAELRNLLIIRAPMATNFLIEEKYHSRLLQIIKKMDEKTPNINLL